MYDIEEQLKNITSLNKKAKQIRPRKTYTRLMAETHKDKNVFKQKKSKKSFKGSFSNSEANKVLMDKTYAKDLSVKVC